MGGCVLSDELTRRSKSMLTLSRGLKNDLRGKLQLLFAQTAPIISIPNRFSKYTAWSAESPSKHGFSFEQRFDFWAENKKGMEGVAFITEAGRLVLPLYREDDLAYTLDLCSGDKDVYNIRNIMPLFPRAVASSNSLSKSKDTFRLFQMGVTQMCAAREEWLKNPDNFRFSQAEQEAISELDEDTMWDIKPKPRPFKDLSAHAQTRAEEQAQKVKQERRAKRNSPANAMAALGAAFSNTATQTFNSELGNEDMTKATQVKTGMYEVNKEAAKQVGYLNAGRASNKLIKESVRPLLNVMFKPTFMQRIAMKLFKTENPVDVALKSGVSDFFCAQLVQAIIEIKGVENEYVREVTQAGIVQSGYELSKAIPFEEAIDKVVKHLEEGAEGVVAKLAKKK